MSSLRKNNFYNWVNITDEFRLAAQKLKLGELVHEETFGLYDAMAAIELMDPKMDSGMIQSKNHPFDLQNGTVVSRKKVIKFEDMIQKQMIKIDDFTIEELLGIIDDTYSCLVTWMHGHSLAQTVLINVFLHNPMLITDKRLRTFSIVILKMVDMICNFIIQASVIEEEDFQPKSYGFDLQISSVNISKIVPMIKLIEDEIKNEIQKFRTSKNSIEDNRGTSIVNLYEALLIRMKFTKYFFLLFYTFKKYLYVQNALSLREFLSHLQENLAYCEQLIPEWLNTIDYGIKPQDTATNNDNKSDYPTIIGFDPLINQRLLAPSFPRHTKIKSRPEAVVYLKEFLDRIGQLLKLNNVDKFVDVLRFFNNYSQQQSSCAVSRSLLQLFYMPKQNLVFGEIEFIKIIKESCKQLIKPPSLSAKITMDSNTKDIVEAFFYRCLVFFKNLIQIYGHNRASQRGKLANVLKDLIFINEECATLEQYMNNQSFCDYLHVWIIFFKFYLMSQYLLSGFELELYSHHEFAYIYFEMDYIWDYLALILQRASEIFLDHEIFIKNATNSQQMNSKTRKKYQKHTKMRNRNSTTMAGNSAATVHHETLMIYYKGMNQMASALHRILMAFKMEHKIKPLNQSLNSEQIRYQHRFMPLLQFEGTLQSYPKYKERYESFAKSSSSKEHIKQLYYESCQLFEQARNHFKAIKDHSFQEEIQSYIKVAKTNNVVLKLILSGHKDHGRIEFSFEDTPYFPIIRFTKK